MGDAETPLQYWQSLFKKHAIQDGFSPTEVMKHLAVIAPDRQLSEPRLYLDVKKNLETVAEHRKKNNFKITGTQGLPSYIDTRRTHGS
ncbi:hypothetical protein CHU98_g2696 [Xylaria longipes]|nr:hypothetical protein CHU98_g2696 [Xylaria longipes]